MKKVLGVLLGLFIVFGVLYTGIWWMKTNELKERVAHDIEEMGKNEKRIFELKYDRLERAGYPFVAELVFVNPKIVTVGHTMEASHVGTVTVGSSLFERDRIWIKSKGKTELNHQTTDKAVNFHVTGDLSVKCDNCVEGVKLYEKSFSEPKDFLAWMKLLLRDTTITVSDLLVEKTSLTDPAVFVPLLKIKNGFVSIQDDVKAEFHHVKLKIDLVQAHTSGDDQSIAELHKLMPYLREDLAKNFFADFGAYDYALEAHATLPTLDHPFYQNPSLETAPSLFSFGIDKSSSKSDILSSSADALLNFRKLEDKNFTALCQCHWQGIFSQKLHSLAVSFLKENAKKEVVKNESEEPIETLAKLIGENAEGLLPDFASFGNINYLIDWNLAAKEGENPNTIKEAHFELKDFKFLCDLYGLEIKGMYKEKNAKDNGNLNLLFLHPKELFRDMRNFYSRWQKVLVESKVMSNLPMMSEEAVNKLVAFLESLATENSEGRVYIPISYDESGMKVGTKTLQEALKALMELQIGLQEELLKSNPNLTKKI